MLKRLYIDNFRCFVNFEYRPDRKQLLLGPNGSGKSSLLDAILFLKWFIEGATDDFTQSTRTRWEPRPTQVVELEAEIDGLPYVYRLEIRYSEKDLLPAVHLERLTAGGALAFEQSAGDIRFFSLDGTPMPSLKWGRYESALRLAQYSNRNVGRFLDWLETLHCFQIDPYPEQMEERAETEDRLPVFNLGNLAPWYLHLLQVDPTGNAHFLSALRDVLNGFQNFRFSSEDDGVKKLRADFTTRGGKEVTFSLSELSEGQRMLIGLYMILHFVIVKGETVLLDEPDNYTALREIQPWLLTTEDTLLESKGQLILISHHPEILNQWAREYGLYFYREENGHVRTKKFEADPAGYLKPSELVARGWENE
ncbi:MAG: ATP-binding protein [Terracidiphilus sp.]